MVNVKVFAEQQTERQTGKKTDRRQDKKYMLLMY